MALTFNQYIKDLVVKPFFKNGEWIVLYRFDSAFGYFSFKDKSKDKVDEEYRSILVKMHQLYDLYSQIKFCKLKKNQVYLDCCRKR